MSCTNPVDQVAAMARNLAQRNKNTEQAKLFRVIRAAGSLDEQIKDLSPASRAALSVLNDGESTVIFASEVPSECDEITKESPKDQSTKIYFGEFRLICLGLVQTTLLLLRSTGK
jgi:hypothetical protein